MKTKINQNSIEISNENDLFINEKYIDTFENAELALQYAKDNCKNKGFAIPIFEVFVSGEIAAIAKFKFKELALDYICKLDLPFGKLDTRVIFI